MAESATIIVERKADGYAATILAFGQRYTLPASATAEDAFKVARAACMLCAPGSPVRIVDRADA